MVNGQCRERKWRDEDVDRISCFPPRDGYAVGYVGAEGALCGSTGDKVNESRLHKC